jgi:hypothetical protein
MDDILIMMDYFTVRIMIALIMKSQTQEIKAIFGRRKRSNLNFKKAFC